jgi:hypothetical protein
MKTSSIESNHNSAISNDLDMLDEADQVIIFGKIYNILNRSPLRFAQNYLIINDVLCACCQRKKCKFRELILYPGALSLTKT